MTENNEKVQEASIEISTTQQGDNVPDLFKLATTHPGGWEDIVNALRAASSDKTFELKGLQWVEEEVPVTNWEGEQVGTETRQYQRVVSEEINVGDLANRLTALQLSNYRTSGEMASDAVRLLRIAGLPVPSGKDWQQPALTWL